jgi:hypothetical protein
MEVILEKGVDIKNKSRNFSKKINTGDLKISVKNKFVLLSSLMDNSLNLFGKYIVPFPAFIQKEPKGLPPQQYIKRYEDYKKKYSQRTMDLFFHYYKGKSWFKSLHHPEVYFRKNEKKEETVNKSNDLFIASLNKNTPIMLKVYECLPSEIDVPQSNSASSSSSTSLSSLNLSSLLLPPQSSSSSFSSPSSSSSPSIPIRPTIIPLSSFRCLGDDPESHTLPPYLLLRHWFPSSTFPSHLPFFALYIEECPADIRLSHFFCYIYIFIFVIFFFLM